MPFVIAFSRVICFSLDLSPCIAITSIRVITSARVVASTQARMLVRTQAHSPNVSDPALPCASLCFSVPAHSALFLSRCWVGERAALYDARKRVDISKHPVILVCAIAQADYLLSYLEDKTEVIGFYKFEDHHYFSNHEVSLINKTYQENKSSKPLIITTEKDATRFHEHRTFLVENRMPMFILPTKVDFHYEQGTEFDELIKGFLLDFRS